MAYVYTHTRVSEKKDGAMKLTPYEHQRYGDSLHLTPRMRAYFRAMHGAVAEYWDKKTEREKRGPTVSFPEQTESIYGEAEYLKRNGLLR